MASLPRFIVTRLLSVIAVVLTVTALTWLVIRLSRPEAYQGDPRSVPEQLWDYLQRVFLHYDFGISFDRQGQPVSAMITKAFPVDVARFAGALLIGPLLGIAAGAFCAARPGTIPARILEMLAAFFLIAPVYWVGLMLILTFGAGFGRIPIPFFETNIYVPFSQDPLTWARSLFVPWLVISAPLASVCLRMMRASMVDVLHEDYLRTATAKGLPAWTVLRRHALPAASSPVLTLAGTQMAVLFTNAVLVEQAFSLPGLFRYTPQAMTDGNFPLLLGMVIAGAVLVVVANMIVDIVHAWIDPRVRV